MFGNRLGHAFSEMLARHFSTHGVTEIVGQHVANKLIKILRAARKSESSSPKNFAGGAFGIGEYY